MRLLNDKVIPITGSTGSVILNILSNVEEYCFTGTATLSTNLSITASGTPKGGDHCILVFDTALTLSTYTFTIFGVTVPKNVAAAPFMILAIYDNSKWNISKAGVMYGTGGGTIGIDSGTGDLEVTDGTLKNVKFAADAAIAFSKMVALTVSKALVTNSSGIVVPSTVTAAEVAYLSGVTEGIQAAFTSIRLTATGLASTVSDLSAAYDITAAAQSVDAGNISTLQGYRTTDSAAIGVLQGQVAALTTGVESYTTLTGNTTLTAATMKQNIRIDATAGAADITLPLANTVTAGFKTNWVVMGANIVRLLRSGSDNVRNLSNADVSSLTITGAGGKWVTQCDGSSIYYEL